MHLLKAEVTDKTAKKLLMADAFLRGLDGNKGKEFTVKAIACFFYLAPHDGYHKQAMEEEKFLGSQIRRENLSPSLNLFCITND